MDITGLPAASRKKAGVRYLRKHSLKTDMTPMVDLGFLLISFFVMTVRMNAPVVEKLYMPHDGPPQKLQMSNALTMLIGDNHTVYYYHGDIGQALEGNEIRQISFDEKKGIGKIIRDKQDFLAKAGISKEGKDGLMVLIKPSGKANYDDVVKALDEMQINNVTRYVLVKPEREEIGWLDARAD